MTKKKLTERQRYNNLYRKHIKSIRLAKSKISTYKTKKGQMAQAARADLLAKRYYNVRMEKFAVLEKFRQIRSSHKITRITSRTKEEARQYRQYVQRQFNKLYRQYERAKRANVHLDFKKISFKVKGSISTIQGMINWFKIDVHESTPEFQQREEIFNRVLLALKKTKYDIEDLNLKSSKMIKKMAGTFSLGDIEEEQEVINFRDREDFTLSPNTLNAETIDYKQFILYTIYVSDLILTDIEIRDDNYTNADLYSLKNYILDNFSEIRVDIDKFIKENMKKD